MKKLLLSASLLAVALGFSQENYTSVTIPLQPGYTNQVYFDFSTENQTAVSVNSWDLALLRTSAMSMGIRINDSRGTRVFEASNNINDWASVTVAQESEWTELYNSETEWETGAFDNGSATYGFGGYNPSTHHVTGSVIFVLKYADNTYKKLIVEDFFSGYTLKYATWNGTEWGADQTQVIPNGTSANSYNYFSLDSNQTVSVAPADTDWDLVFGRYYGNVGTEEEPTMYLVNGVLHNSATVTIAETDETGETDAEPALPADEAYSENINVIGDDWKEFNMGTFSYVINPEKTFYVKHNDGTIYRVYFTSFEGTSTGNLSFNFANVTPTASLDKVNSNISFGMYPNPASGSVTIMYDIKSASADKNTVSIYSLTGAKVLETEVTNNSGFFTKELNISNLSGGVYMVQIQSGNATQTKKLVVR